MSMNFETKMRDIKEQVMLDACLSEEETATQTPRSTSDSYNESSSLETPRSSSKSGDADDTYDDSYQEDDEYYAFLREMAGSFVQEQDDSGSEGGSEDGAGSEDEDEDFEPIESRKLTPELGSSDPDTTTDNGQSSPHLSPACGQARQGGGGQGADGSAGKAGLGEEKGRRRLASNREGARSREESPSSYDDRCRVPPPSRDNRPPVEDDYDVVQATLDFAARRQGSRLQQRREDLQECIRQKQWQAHRISGVASSESVGLSLREHYSRVRDELLEEARKHEAELAALEEEEANTDDDKASDKLIDLSRKATPPLGLHMGEVCQVACG